MWYNIFSKARNQREEAVTAKTELTLMLESNIWKATHKQGVFSAFEVTIGWSGNERVDYMTYDTKRIFRCYEIKVSKSDFHSSAAKTFCGHFNYFVMPFALFQQVKEEIPKDIGVFCEARSRDPQLAKREPCVCVRRAKRRELTESPDVLKDSMIRSLSRDLGKQMLSGSPTLVECYDRELAEARRMIKHYRTQAERMREQYENLYRVVDETFGADWQNGPGKNFADSM